MGHERAISDSRSAWVVYSAFFVFLFFQHQFVFLAQDDYGFAVLHFFGSEQTGFKGQDFSFRDFLNFITEVYMRWGGRFGAWSSLIWVQKAGVEFTRLIQSLTIVCLCLFSFMISRRNHVLTNAYLQLLSIILFFSIPVRTVIDGVYWFAAASTYLWASPFFISGVYVSYRYGRLTVPAILLLSIAASFGEQWSFATAAYTLSFIIFYSIQNRDKAIRACGKTSPIFFISALVVIAPGNFVRLKASILSQLHADQNLFEMAPSNSKGVIERIFDPADNVFLFFLILIFYIFLRSLHMKCKSLLVQKHLPFPSHLFNLTTTGRVVLSTQVSALASLIPLFFLPPTPHRSLLPFFLIEICPIISAFSWSLKFTKIEQYVILSAVCVLGNFSIQNASYIYKGYRTNYEIHSMNDAKLRAASSIQRNMPGRYTRGEVRLFRLKDPRFGRPMPYDGRPFIGVCMKKYYRLDPDTELRWE